ncbi:hypothetical protein Tco_0790088 [Tanacetum coccineum]
MMNVRVEYPRTHSTSPTETYAPYKPSPRLDLFEQPPCLGSTFVSEAIWKSDQMHQTFENSSLRMTHKLDDMIELPKLQFKKTYKVELECEIVMMKIPKCMSWLDACDEPIGDLDMMEDKVDNPSHNILVMVILRKKYRWGTVFPTGLKRYKEPLVEPKEIG